MDQSDCGLIYIYIKGKKKDQTGVASICYNDQVYKSSELPDNLALLYSRCFLLRVA